jgi:hypothetical protein
MKGQLQSQADHWHVSVAVPVIVEPCELVPVAVTVTGAGVALMHVARPLSTFGVLPILVFTVSETDHFKSTLRGPGVGGQPGGGLSPPTKEIILPGAAALWLALAEEGATKSDTASPQFGCECPPQPPVPPNMNTLTTTEHKICLVLLLIALTLPHPILDYKIGQQPR